MTELTNKIKLIIKEFPEKEQELVDNADIEASDHEGEYEHEKAFCKLQDYRKLYEICRRVMKQYYEEEHPPVPITRCRSERKYGNCFIMSGIHFEEIKEYYEPCYDKEIEEITNQYPNKIKPQKEDLLKAKDAYLKLNKQYVEVMKIRENVGNLGREALKNLRDICEALHEDEWCPHGIDQDDIGATCHWIRSWDDRYWWDINKKLKEAGLPEMEAKEHMDY